MSRIDIIVHHLFIHSKFCEQAHRAVLIVLMSMMCMSCRHTRQHAEPSPRHQFEEAQSQLNAFISGIPMEQVGARLTWRRLELDGVAPLELVVEQRCDPGVCEYGELERRSSTIPLLSRFDLYTVPERGAPVPLHNVPIYARAFATLEAVHECDPTRHYVLVRERIGLNDVTFRDLSATVLSLDVSSEASKESVAWSHAHFRQPDCDGLTFVDLTGDGLEEWVCLSGRSSPMALFDPWPLDQASTAHPLASYPIPLTAWPMSSAQLSELWSPQPGDLLERLFDDLYVMIIMQFSGDPPTNLTQQLAHIMIAYDTLRQAGHPFVYEERRGRYGDDEERRQAVLKINHSHMPQHTFMATLMLAALAWPDQPDVHAWSRERLKESTHPGEIAALTRIVILSTSESSRQGVATRYVDDALVQLQDIKVLAHEELSPEVQRAQSVLLGAWSVNERTRKVFYRYNRSRRREYHAHIDELLWNARASFEPLCDAWLEQPNGLENISEFAPVLMACGAHYLGMTWSSRSFKERAAFLGEFLEHYYRYADGTSSQKHDDAQLYVIASDLLEQDVLERSFVSLVATYLHHVPRDPELLRTLLNKLRLKHKDGLAFAFKGYQHLLNQMIMKSWELHNTESIVWWATWFNSQYQDEGLYANIASKTWSSEPFAVDKFFAVADAIPPAQRFTMFISTLPTFARFPERATQAQRALYESHINALLEEPVSRRTLYLIRSLENVMSVEGYTLSEATQLSLIKLTTDEATAKDERVSLAASAVLARTGDYFELYRKCVEAYIRGEYHEEPYLHPAYKARHMELWPPRARKR